ncbi:MAG TPA: hypothetical protein PLJ21_05885 [Pseudobdellovibrionaceae bacterium]|nr:hypothetical protein [Pseudobdellovibrionaceae bacterium]
MTYKHIKIFFYSITFLFFLTACSTLSEQGESALKEGDVDKALYLYQRSAQEEKSVDGLSGLKKAQQSWIEKKLIDVRLLRLGNNLTASEALLLQLLKNEEEWNIFAKGAAFSTQSEEVLFFAQRIHRRIENFLANDNPIAAQSELMKNSFILEKALGANISNLKNQIYKKGHIYCKSAENSLKKNEYFSFIWLKKTCQTWKINLKTANLQSSVQLIKDISPVIDVSGLNKSIHEDLIQNFRQAFRKSHWFDENGSAILPIFFTGKFEASQSETPVNRLAKYSVLVPYEEKSIRKKQPQSDTTGLVSALVFLFGSSSGERTFDNQDGTETVYVTKYRSEPRVKEYPAIALRANKELVGEIKAHIQNQEFKTEVRGDYQFNEDRHEMNFPDIGLVPSNPQFISDIDWIRSMSPHWMNKITSELKDLWIQRFCAPFEVNAQSLSEREQAHRCAFQLDTGAPESLRQFYFKNFSIAFEDWKALVEAR